MSDLYRIDPKAHDAYDGSYTGGLPDPISFLVDDGVLVYVEPCEHGNYDIHPAGYAEVRAREGDVLRGTTGWCPGARLDDDE